MGRAAIVLWIFASGCEVVFPLEAPQFDAAFETTCPDGYVGITGGNRKYHFLTGEAWSVAVGLCTSDRKGAQGNTHLVVLDNVKELEGINLATPGADDVWIGLSDRKLKGTFKTVSDEPYDYPLPGNVAWAAGEPLDGDGDCVVMRRPLGRLEAIDCGQTNSVACECDEFADAPGNY
jgi:hypothetical protein